MKLYVLFAITVFGFLCCQSGNDQINMAEAMELPEERVPPASACELITVEDVQEILKLEPSSVDKKLGGLSENSQSCFFRWNDPDFPNAAILIQALANPVFEEFPDWPSTFIDAKMVEGEVALGTTEPMLFKEFNGVGHDGAYNPITGKYYWRYKNEQVFMLAFNLDISEKDQLSAAKKIARIVMENYISRETAI